MSGSVQSPIAAKPLRAAGLSRHSDSDQVPGTASANAVTVLIRVPKTKNSGSSTRPTGRASLPRSRPARVRSAGPLTEYQDVAVGVLYLKLPIAVGLLLQWTAD